MNKRVKVFGVGIVGRWERVFNDEWSVNGFNDYYVFVFLWDICKVFWCNCLYMMI